MYCLYITSLPYTDIRPITYVIQFNLAVIYCLYDKYYRSTTSKFPGLDHDIRLAVCYPIRGLVRRGYYHHYHHSHDHYLATVYSIALHNCFKKKKNKKNVVGENNSGSHIEKVRNEF